MSDQVDARLQRLLGGEHLASLRKRLRHHFERAPLNEAVDHIRVTSLSAEEHTALASLANRPQRHANSLRIDVGRIDSDLRRTGIATCLHDALEKLDGPILHHATARLRLQTLWSGVIDGRRHPGLGRLLQTPEGIGLLKRLARQDAIAAAELCRRAEEVLRHLPAKGITRSQLAADVLGDAHALDTGCGAATLVLAVWRQTAAPVPDEDSDRVSKPSGDIDPERASGVECANRVERLRDIWARAGVLVNELARPALFLNLPAVTDSDCCPPGEPAYASLRGCLRTVST